MKTSKLLVGVLALFALGLQACGQKSDSGAPVTAGRGAGSTATSSLSQYQYSLAPVSNANAQSVTNFLAAATDPSKIGQIQNVQIAGHIVVSTYGQVSGNNSSGIFLRVIDSYASSGQYPPFDIVMPYTSGSVQNGQLNLVFSDNYGSLVISGSYNSSMVQGQITYQNTNGSSGMIGNFSIPYNNFFANN